LSALFRTIGNSTTRNQRRFLYGGLLIFDFLQ